MSNPQLLASIQEKLPASALAEVCKNAPEGNDDSGKSYKEMCNACLAVQADDDQSTHEVQAACMAKVIGSYIEKTGAATPDADAAAAAPAADDTAADPVKPTTALTTCPDGSAPVAGNCMR